MLQQINLYQAEDNIRQEPFSAFLMLLITLFSILIMSVLYGLLFWQQGTLNKDITALSGQYQQNLIAVEKLETLVKALNNTDKEKAQFRILNSILKNKQGNLKQLSSLVKGNSSGLSTYFTALARKNIKAIWFTEITVSDGGKKLLLKGKTKDAHQIPSFIESLKEETAFSGVNFRLFNAQLNQKDGLVYFILQTDLENPEKI